MIVSNKRIVETQTDMNLLYHNNLYSTNKQIKREYNKDNSFQNLLDNEVMRIYDCEKTDT